MAKETKVMVTKGRGGSEAAGGPDEGSGHRSNWAEDSTGGHRDKESEKKIRVRAID